ncbi:MAG TPA: tRNA (adenosine(37)-N6)-threonylcarbamoyltransferase complex ATPase subunit type 1 TsaE [Tepiditoga sp.]|nr:tRNA (adenosine(37)-N6)-threonylcarbamoyltransferase complex ATPase subunit type 1 TsaE [Tepiditoga sp.]
MDENQIKTLAERISKIIYPGIKFMLTGDLGTGKTTFAGYLINSLSDKKFNVSSPTFSIVKEYNSVYKIVHADLYRIADPQEIEYIDLFNDNEAVYIIEWAEFLDYLMPEERIEIYLEYCGISSRNVIIKGYGDKNKKLIEYMEVK